MASAPLLRKSYEEIPLGARRESNELFARLYSPMHGLEFALLQNCEEGAGRYAASTEAHWGADSQDCAPLLAGLRGYSYQRHWSFNEGTFAPLLMRVEALTLAERTGG